MPVFLYKCRFEYVASGLQYTENVYIVSHSAEGCEEFICDALGVRELKYREFIPIAQINGFSNLICQQITQQNAKQYLDSVEIAKGLDGTSFPTAQSVEDYRRKMDSILYRYDITQKSLQPELGRKNTRIDPPTELKEKYDDELQKKYSVWGIIK